MDTLYPRKKCIYTLSHMKASGEAAKGCWPRHSGSISTAKAEFEDQESALRDAALASLLFGLALLTYASTRAMRVIGGDSGELMAMSCQRGVAHPPGYPLLTMLGSRCEISVLPMLVLCLPKMSGVCDPSVLQLAARVSGYLWAAVCKALAAVGNHGLLLRRPPSIGRYRLCLFAIVVLALHFFSRANSWA